MAKSREALLRKAQKRAAKRRAARVKPILLAPHQRKTHPAYRNQLPRLPVMSKRELRDMLAEAVANTRAV